MLPIAISAEATERERELVLSWLREYKLGANRAFMRSLEDGAEEEVFLVARDDAGNAVGGLLGSILHSWLRIDIMAVASERRCSGIGTELLSRAETIATSQGCEFSYVDSMSNQAPAFYESRGYREVGRLPNWDSHGNDKHFFMKGLNTHSPAASSEPVTVNDPRRWGKS